LLLYIRQVEGEKEEGDAVIKSFVVLYIKKKKRGGGGGGGGGESQRNQISTSTSISDMGTSLHTCIHIYIFPSSL
jgi:hypothetical protein